MSVTTAPSGDAPPEEGQQAQPHRLLRNSNFVLFGIVRVASALAFQGASVAIGWMVYEKTGSAYDLGLVGLFQFLPMIVMTFIVGNVADRYHRGRIVFWCQLAQAAILAFLLFGLHGAWLSVNMIFGAVAVLGAARSFQQPTMSALLPSIVPTAILQRAVAASSSFMQTATIIGPSLGGALYAISPDLSLGLCAAFLVLGALSVAFIKGQHKVANKAPVTLASFFGGVSFIRRHPVILGTISLDLFAVLLGGVTALLPIFASDILHTGPWGLGMLRSAPALGALSMSLVLARVSLDKGAGYKMFAAVLVFGLATVVFSLSTNLILSLFCLFVLGAADNVSVVVRSSLVQLQTPDDMRGRVNAVNFLFIGASNQLGEFESGMMAGLLGAVPSGVIGGIGTIVVALLWMRLFPQLRRVESLSG